MGWGRTAGHGAGNEPDPGFGPPRRGAPWSEGSRTDDDSGTSPGPDPAGVPRDERLAGFVVDGEQDTARPSGELAGVLESVSGAGWRCPGATDDEMVGMVRRWASVESWAGAAKLGVIRELIRRGSPDPRFQRWIDTYGGEEFGAVVQDVLAEADAMAPFLSNAERARVHRHFRVTSRYEWMFWDMGYRQESWPV